MAAAHAASPPLDSFLIDFVATAELRAYPKPALAAFQLLFEKAQSISALSGDADDPLYYARYDLQLDAIYAFALQHQWHAALLLARQFEPGKSYAKSSAYGPVVLQMASSKDFALATAALLECYRADGSFPYRAARVFLSRGKLAPAEAVAVAQLGLQVAGTEQPPPDSAARFLAAVHATLPDLDSQIEDAATLMLGHLQVALPTGGAQLASEQRYFNQTGSRVLTLLGQIDPTRAETESEQHPSFAYLSPRPNLQIQVTGERPGLVPARPDKGSAALADKAERFAALVKLAQSLASQRSAAAGQAASEADSLLDEQILAEDPLSVVRLAAAFRVLHDDNSAQSLVEQSLSTAVALAQRDAARFSQLTPEQQAEKWSAIRLAVEPVVLIFCTAAKLNPRLSERSARALNYPAFATMVQASVAAGEAGEPNVRSLLALVGPQGH